MQNKEHFHDQQPKFEFNGEPAFTENQRVRFRADVKDDSEFGFSTKELVKIPKEDGFEYYDEDGSRYEKQGELYLLKQKFPPGYQAMYEKVKEDNPNERDEIIEFWTLERLKKLNRNKEQ